jgi:phenylalanyl-tRNA synthetase alpha chain
VGWGGWFFFFFFFFFVLGSGGTTPADSVCGGRFRSAWRRRLALSRSASGRSSIPYCCRSSSCADCRDCQWPDSTLPCRAWREVHENGKYGSIGYRYPWKADESLRLVLRTHTTAISAAMLHKLAQNPGPARYFSIDRVFRNETVDATHLAEFHQVEGVIADSGLTLGGLIGFMKEFFKKMGIDDLCFKPAYNPYTKPSMEIFGEHKGLGKWVEIGNSGMFRPEMLESMGLPKDLRVYGWGLSLERPTMIRYKVSNIRELLGHKVDLGFIENNAAVRLDKS